MSYQLEGKVVELTRHVESTQKKCRALEKKNKELESIRKQHESQLLTATEREKSDAESSKLKIAAINEDRERLKAEYAQLVKEDRITSLEELDIVKGPKALLLKKREKARADKIEQFLTGLTEQLGSQSQRRA